MVQSITNSQSVEWKEYEKIVLRFFSAYFLLQIIPIDPKFYKLLFSINWLQLDYADIFNLAHYTPQFFAGGQSFANWLVVAVLAIAATFIWSFIETKKRQEADNNTLYYWTRVIVRYRLAIAVFAYGFIKFFPLQSPYPSISNLNTQYGSLTDWKMFSLSLGIVPNYQSFLGFIEILSGALLLYRRTASIGAFIIIVFTGNVFFSNLAYEGGEYVYSFYLITLALFILFFDLNRLANLVSFEKPAVPNTWHPSFFKGRLKYGRIALKALIIFLFAGLYGFQTRSAYKNNNSYHIPNTKGLPNTSGIYNVASFILKKDTLAYSPNDPVRWKDVVFEKWNTISIRSNRPVIIDSNNVEKITLDNKERNYEAEGVADRHYYSYTIDSLNHLLTLHNKNTHYVNETLQLNYSIKGNGSIHLSGVNENNDSIHVVLNRINKKYLLEEAAKSGRRKGIKI